MAAYSAYSHQDLIPFYILAYSRLKCIIYELTERAPCGAVITCVHDLFRLVRIKKKQTETITRATNEYIFPFGSDYISINS